MPRFEHVVTIVALLIGPAGIWFGWWLSERSTEKRETHAQKSARDQAERQRALELARVARKLSSEARSLAYAVYLSSAEGKTVHGIRDLIEEFNTIRGAYREAVLVTRVLGPSWVVEQGEAIEFKGQVMTQLISEMQGAPSNDLRARITAEILELDASVDALVEALSHRYNEGVSRLPPRPDLEAAK